MAQSENIQRFEEKLSHQHEKLIASKIRVDIEISTNELGALLQEEQYLLERSLFSRQQCQTDLERLVKTK